MRIAKVLVLDSRLNSTNNSTKEIRIINKRKRHDNKTKTKKRNDNKDKKSMKSQPGAKSNKVF